MNPLYKTFFGLIFLILNSNFSFGQAALVKFEVRVPSEGLRKDASIFLAGSFNCWNPHDSSYIMKKQADNLYSIVIPVFDGKKYEYKYTQGDWNSVEVAQNGSEIINREIVSRKDMVIIDTVFKWKSSLAEQKKDTSLKLSPEQLQAFSKLKEEMSKSLEVKIKKFGDMLKKTITNMLSEKPNMRLKSKYHKEMVAEINKALDIAAGIIWKITSILTPQQKKAMLAELNKPNSSGDIFSTISKMMSSPQK